MTIKIRVSDFVVNVHRTYSQDYFIVLIGIELFTKHKKCVKILEVGQYVTWIRITTSSIQLTFLEFWSWQINSSAERSTKNFPYKWFGPLQMNTILGLRTIKFVPCTIMVPGVPAENLNPLPEDPLPEKTELGRERRRTLVCGPWVPVPNRQVCKAITLQSQWIGITSIDHFKLNE